MLEMRSVYYLYVPTFENNLYISYRNERGLLHRIEGPANICDNFLEWRINSKLARKEGPVLIQARRDLGLTSVYKHYWKGNKLKCRLFSKTPVKTTVAAN